MFGTNEIVGQKHFKNADKDKLLVTSRFFTLQGEGPFRGQPAFFIRLAKCNLNCSFCDTYFDSGNWMTFDEIEQDIEKSIKEYFDNVPEWARTETNTRFVHGGCLVKRNKLRDMVLVITGGEPMLQHNIVSFLKRMNQQFENTQIESNGLIYQDLPAGTTLVVSPKCLEKDGIASKYLNPNDKVLERADCLKFVMEYDKLSPYSSIPDWAFEWRDKTHKDIYISPMNIYLKQPLKTKDQSVEERSKVDEVISWWTPGLLDMKANQKNHEYAARYCLDNGFIFNMQIHLFASLA